MNDSLSVVLNLTCVGLILQLLVGLEKWSSSLLSHTKTCKYKTNLNHVKTRGNEEACFCFNEQLLRFCPTDCLGGCGWLKHESFPSMYCMFSGFPPLCWCKLIHCVVWTLPASSDTVWLRFSLFSEGVVTSHWTGVWAAKWAYPLWPHIRLITNKHLALLMTIKYELKVTHTATKNSNPAHFIHI